MNIPKSRTSRLSLFLIVAAIGLTLDLATKHWIFAKLGMPGANRVWWIIKDVFGFQTSINQGALFGLGQGQIPLFVTLSFVALVGVCWWVWSDVSRSRYLAFTLGLIAAGIIGNLWDRCALHGMRWSDFDIEVWNAPAEQLGQPIHAVRDWILVMIGNYLWPNFNIADSCLVCGAILIGIYAVLMPPLQRQLPGGLDGVFHRSFQRLWKTNQNEKSPDSSLGSFHLLTPQRHSYLITPLTVLRSDPFHYSRQRIHTEISQNPPVASSFQRQQFIRHV